MDECGSAITRTTADAVPQKQLPCHSARGAGRQGTLRVVRRMMTIWKSLMDVR
jgi:hypothetical protein